MMEGYRFAKHENFLSPKVAEEASRYCDSLINSNEHVWTTNFGWLKGKEQDFSNEKLERYNNLVLVHQIAKSNEKLYNKICADIKRHYPNLVPESRNSVQYFVWTGGSCIEWHNDFTKHKDKKRCGAITIYLNRTWSVEWGGDFLYKDENRKVHRVTPEYNLAVSIGQVDHRSTEVKGRRFRKCIQIFVKEEEPTIDFDENFC
jgi:Rps23 Pro-64 3,4-dihydroxylase Tpa1-like proline 4-hydroxylase